jgi:hypothetical protein
MRSRVGVGQRSRSEPGHPEVGDHHCSYPGEENRRHDQIPHEGDPAGELDARDLRHRATGPSTRRPSPPPDTKAS